MQVGNKVGAIVSGDPETKVVYFLGYGIYEGDQVPPKGVTFLGLDLSELGHTNPKIVLDSGEVVWGCQVWWGPEAAVQKRIAGYESAGFSINKITMQEYMKTIPETKLED